MGFAPRTVNTIAVSQERRSDSGTDTARYLAAGAAQSFWVRTRQGQLHEAMPRVRQLLASAEHCIVESNSVLRFLQPDVFVSVLDPTVADFKESALRYLDRADALVFPEGAAADSAWAAVASSLLKRPHRFSLTKDRYCSAELARFVAGRLDAGRIVAGERVDSLSPAKALRASSTTKAGGTI